MTPRHELPIRREGAGAKGRKRMAGLQSDALEAGGGPVKCRNVNAGFAMSGRMRGAASRSGVFPAR